MFCTHCGTKIEADSNFCISCGAKIKEDSEISLQQEQGQDTANISAGKVNGVVVWKGMRYIIDCQAEVKLDGYLIGHGSLKKGFQISFSTMTGAHIITVGWAASSLKIISGDVSYPLSFDEIGSYRVLIQYDRYQGKWGEVSLTKS